MTKIQKYAALSLVFLVIACLACLYMPSPEDTGKATPIYLSGFAVIVYFSIATYFSIKAATRH